ncbi:MAG TPA: cytochrome c [Gemmataceae bacterium]|nr:cytochrome c [Gemmataceae bacterium]
MKSQRRFALRLLPCFALAVLIGCQQKMAKQPSYKPLESTSFFADGQSARPLVPGTVPRGHLRIDWPLFTGKNTPESRDWTFAPAVLGAADLSGLSATAVALAEQANTVRVFPFPVTRNVLQHGQNRFLIYCAVCHDPLGTGRGKIVERGYTAPPSYHIERLRQVPVGHFFEVMTHGYGSMPSYSEQVPPRDRWAIAAYIRALQLSQHFPASQLTDEMRREWNHARGSQPREEQRP